MIRWWKLYGLVVASFERKCGRLRGRRVRRGCLVVVPFQRCSIGIGAKGETNQCSKTIKLLRRMVQLNFPISEAMLL